MLVVRDPLRPRRGFRCILLVQLFFIFFFSIRVGRDKRLPNGKYVCERGKNTVN